MADSKKLEEVGALLAERDDQFRPMEKAAQQSENGEPFWPLNELKRVLGYAADESIEPALNRAKIAARNNDWPLSEHFVKVKDLYTNEDYLLSKFAALLVTMNADVNKPMVSKAQEFFALQADAQLVEDEKRLKNRLDVATENRKLTGVAKDKGVVDFRKFNGMGVAALYGGLSVVEIVRLKRLKKGVNHLDFAGSEELAANLFRITQTSAALHRQAIPNEEQACTTHQTVAGRVRRTILEMGNTPPESLPPATTQIDRLATAKKRELLPSTVKGGKQPDHLKKAKKLAGQAESSSVAGKQKKLLD